jgi:uncharacterized protein YbaP (TraB family)
MLLSLICAVLIESSAAQAAVYKCLDAKQNVVYRDKPCQDLTSVKLPPALSQMASEEEHLHMLWKARKESGGIFLLGALNYGSRDMYPLPDAIMDAFSESQVLVMMINLNSQALATIKSNLQSKGTYTDESVLKDHIKPITLNRLLDLVKTFNIPEETVLSQKPWMAALTLRDYAAKQVGFNEEFDINKTFTQAAGTLKPIIKVDFSEEQIKSYEQATENEQEQMLLMALDEAEDQTERFKSLEKAWQQGDLEEMRVLFRGGVNLYSEVQKVLNSYAERQNEAIVKKIEELVADGRTYFVIVDVRTLVGDQNLRELLEAKGFQLSQL